MKFQYQRWKEHLVKRHHFYRRRPHWDSYTNRWIVVLYQIFCSLDTYSFKHLWPLHTWRCGPPVSNRLTLGLQITQIVFTFVEGDRDKVGSDGKGSGEVWTHGFTSELTWSDKCLDVGPPWWGVQTSRRRQGVHSLAGMLDRRSGMATRRVKKKCMLGHTSSPSQCVWFTACVQHRLHFPHMFAVCLCIVNVAPSVLLFVGAWSCSAHDQRQFPLCVSDLVVVYVWAPEVLKEARCDMHIAIILEPVSSQLFLCAF